MADGSDIVTGIASLVDEQGNVKRLGMEAVLFEVSGEGRLLGNDLTGANPRKLEWGTAPCLVQATTKSGQITVKARMLFEGSTTPQPGEVTFSSVASGHKLLFMEEAVDSTKVSESLGRTHGQNAEKDAGLKKVGNQQTEFEHH